MTATVRSGGCQCGAIRFETIGKPRFVANCHCRDCRRATGAAFSTWVGYAEKQLAWKGEAAAYASSPGVLRGYCPECGSPLTYRGDKWPGETHILIGAFDEPDGFLPTGDVFIEDALPFSRPKA